MDLEGRTHYEVLGVADDVAAKDLRKAFLSLVRTYHPDVYGPEGTRITARLNEAYSVLSDASARADYDRSLVEPEPEPEPEVEPEPFVDEWGAEADWVDAEVVETEPVVRPESPPVTEPAASTVTGGEQVVQPAPQARRPWRRRRTVSTRPVTTGAAGWVLGLGALVPVLVPAWLWVTSVPPAWLAVLAARVPVPVPLPLLVGPLALLVGLLVGTSRPRWVPTRRKLVGWLVVGWVAAFVEVLALALLLPWGSVAALLGAAVSGWTLGWGTSLLTRFARGLAAVLPSAQLSRFEVFGQVAGGVPAAMLDADLQALVRGGVRLFRVGRDDAPYTHALVLGRRVELFKAVSARSGRHRWSGDTLLREEGTALFEVMRCPYADVGAGFEQRLPRGVRVRRWLLLYDELPGGSSQADGHGMWPVVSDPETALAEVSVDLAAGAERIDAEVAVAVVRALQQQ